MAELKCMKLTDTAKIPTRGSKESAGLDIYSDKSCSIKPGGRCLVSTGIAVSFNPGYVMRLVPRSGLTVKYGITVGAGVIDSDYRGEVKVVIYNLGGEDVYFESGDRVAQALLYTVDISDPVEVDTLSGSDRGTGGFGSTGV